MDSSLNVVKGFFPYGCGQIKQTKLQAKISLRHLNFILLFNQLAQFPDDTAVRKSLSRTESGAAVFDTFTTGHLFASGG